MSEQKQTMTPPEKPAIQFSDSQQKVIDARGKNLLVSASAGAGKTAVLVERLCRLVIDDRIPISAILAMTFTEDAAREMKTRLQERLARCDQNDPWIAAQLSDLQRASISTIHSFCLDIVQHYYYLAGLSYSMASRVDNGLADEQAMEQALKNAREQLDPKAMAGLMVYLESFSKNDSDLRSLILKFLETARSKPDASAWMEWCRQPDEKKMKPWFLEWYSLRIQALMNIFGGMQDVIEEMSFAKKERQQEYLRLFGLKLEKLQVCLDDLQSEDYDAFGYHFIEYIETTGKFTPTINKVRFDQIQKESRGLEKEIADALFTPADFEQARQAAAPVQEAFVDLAIAASREFSKIKEEQQFIDFADMEQFAWKILQNPIARNELKERYQIILVDEYQDTNDLQEAIINAIARENNVFRVGDIKQSIYGFRQARPELMKHHMEHAGPLDSVIAMQENYRSSARLIRFNNEFFSRLMNVKGLPSQFSAIDEAFPGTEGQKNRPQMPVRFLYTVYGNWQDPKKDPELDKTSGLQARSIHRRNRYDLIARDIARKVKAGQVSLREIAILSRSSTPHDDLKNALEAWGIRSIHHMKKGFYTNKSVQIVLSAMRMIADRRNDIALMAALCSPLTGLKQEDLLVLIQDRQPDESLYAALRNTEKGRDLLETVWTMEKWKSLPLPEIISNIYAYNRFYEDATTSQDKTNLDLLLQKAVDAQDMMDLETFLDSAGLEENLDKTSEAIPFAKEENAVRISTIHASKGLQYRLVYILSEQTNRDMEASSPITIDPDLGLALEGLLPDRQIRQKSAQTLALSHKRFMEDQQEKMRLLYVACTRAEDELVFVDSLKQDDLYDWDFDIRALLSNNGFTSWFFHIWHRHPGLDVKFEEVDILERPDGKLGEGRKVRLKTYAGPVSVIRSQTASQAKEETRWEKTVPALKSGGAPAKSRGTLMHEMVSRLSFPYREDEISEMARAYGMKWSERDQEEVLSLNDCSQYAKWMDQPHAFECSYVAMDEGAIVHGFMDLAVFGKDTVEIVDFKSDKVMNEGQLTRKYAGQLETYRRAMEQIEQEKSRKDPRHKARAVRTWIYSFYLRSLFELKPE